MNIVKKVGLFLALSWSSKFVGASLKTDAGVGSRRMKFACFRWMCAAQPCLKRLAPKLGKVNADLMTLSQDSEPFGYRESRHDERPTWAGAHF